MEGGGRAEDIAEFGVEILEGQAAQTQGAEVRRAVAVGQRVVEVGLGIAGTAEEHVNTPIADPGLVVTGPCTSGPRPHTMR
jgi:hypothetical protein